MRPGIAPQTWSRVVANPSSSCTERKATRDIRVAVALHPHAAGRVHAANGDVYISVALAWLWVVDAVRPTLTDALGVGLCLVGASTIMLGSRPPIAATFWQIAIIANAEKSHN